MTLYKKLQNPALVHALAHPLRSKMLTALRESEASSKELAAHFGVPPSTAAYHLQVLRKLKLVRLVRETPRRGAVEHYYKADRDVHIDDDGWDLTPGLFKERLVDALLEDIGADASAAAANGGFERRNAHLTRSRLVLDEEGWNLLAVKLLELYELADQLHKQRAKRPDHARELRIGLVMMLFESGPGRSDDGLASTT